MSIFKSKIWWTNETLQGVTSISGFQNNNSLKVDKFSSFNDSDCIVVSEGSNLKIYKPHDGDHATSHVVLEKELNCLILQVDTGKFLMNSADQQIIVLHPGSFSIYDLERKHGQSDVGEENVFVPVITHKLNRTAYTLKSGHFGNLKNRDLICVQGLDGSLSFYDQEIFLFTCSFNDIIVPGPISYITSSDCFVICKSNWIMEIYSYQQIREISEAHSRPTKKTIPQWCYNAGEEISNIQVIQTSSNFSSIIVLGERYLYCFQDNGLMKFMKKLDFLPICFHAYLIGWYYEPGARLLVMVASEDSKLYIYEGTVLLWSCDLVHLPISIARCYLKGLPGGLVILSANGVVCVSYIGTEPDLSGFGQATFNDSYSADAIQTELETAEETLQRIMSNNGDVEDQTALQDNIKINIDVGKAEQNLFYQSEYFDNDALHLLMSQIAIKLTFENPSLIQGLQISYICYPPFFSSEATVCLDSVNGIEIIQTNVFLSGELDIINAFMKILFTVTNENGRIFVITKVIQLPINLYCAPVQTNNEMICKIVINTSNKCLDLTELFTEFGNEHGNISNSMSLRFRASKKDVTISTSEQQYIIKSNDYADTIAILEMLVYKLYSYYGEHGKTFEFSILLDKELSNQLKHTFLKHIEQHAKARIKLKNHEDELNVLHRQFTLIQKKLLVQYGSLPPGDCDPLEYLMKDTYRRLQETTHEIIHSKEALCRAGNSLVAVGNLVIYILRLTISDKFKVKLIEEMLTLNSLYDDYQDWEEAVSQSISYILNNIFTKTEKDKEKLAPVTEQGILSLVNLKRFLKQIRLILDRMFSEALLNGNNTDAKDSSHTSKVIRVEELVEVI